MTRNQKLLCFSIVLLVAIAAAVPTIWVLKYNKRLLPVSGSVQQKMQTVPQLPLTTLVAPDDSITTRPAEKLSEEQKIGLATGLAMVFHVRTDNLAYYFPYFTMIQFGSKGNISALAIVFSQNPPQVNAGNGIRKVSWDGQYIGFDLTRKRMVYAVDGMFQFDGADVLEVSIHSSSAFLELGTLEQQVDPRKKAPTMPSERF